jgi:hypothetical protein
MTSEPKTEVVSQDAVGRALDAYRKAGGQPDGGMRESLRAALAEGTFKIGDEVIGPDGGVAGVIIEIHDDEAVISWETRGNSSESVDTLAHVGPDTPE